MTRRGDRARRWVRIAAPALALGAGVLGGRTMSGCEPSGKPKRPIISVRDPVPVHSTDLGDAQLVDGSRTGIGADDVRTRPGADVASDASVSGPESPPHRPGRMGLMPAFTFHPRAPDEWQGWRVDLSLRPGCDTSSRCTAGLACLADQMCGPCSHDSDCAGGEICVLDRCLLRERAGCRNRRDCRDGELCITTEPSPDPRGNGFTKSFCSTANDTPVSTQDLATVAEDYQRAAELNPRSIPAPPQARQPPEPDHPALLDRLRSKP